LLSTVSLAALQAAPAGGSDDSGIAQFAVVDVAGDPALAALVVSEGALTVHVLDLFTGATLYEVPFSGSPMAYRNHHTALARLGTTTPLFAAVLESRDTTAHVVEVRELETGMIPPAHVTGPRVIKEGGGGSMGVLSLLALLLAQLLPWRSRRARDLAYTSPI
jgi:hypothetical protein